MDNIDLRSGQQNEYDGTFKDYTKDCPSCEFKKMHPIKDRDACYWGVAWKYLCETSNPRKCALLKEESPRKVHLLERLRLREEWDKLKYRNVSNTVPTHIANENP